MDERLSSLIGGIYDAALDGDKKADFTIQLDGHIALTSDDFLFTD